MGSLESTTRTGRFTVEVSPNRAIGLFTAEGERGWVDGWEPRYPAGGEDRDRVGTVFLTAGAEGADVVWVVTCVGELERRYARFDHRGTVGTVEVRCRAAGAATEVEVTYRLTAMTVEAGRELERFAAGYEAMMEAWGARIRVVLLPRDG